LPRTTQTRLISARGMPIKRGRFEVVPHPLPPVSWNVGNGARLKGAGGGQDRAEACRKHRKYQSGSAAEVLERREGVFEVFPVLSGVGGHDFRRVAQGATFHHDWPVKARLLQLGEQRPEIHFACAEPEPDRAALLLAILGAEAGDLVRNRLEPSEMPRGFFRWLPVLRSSTAEGGAGNGARTALKGWRRVEAKSIVCPQLTRRTPECKGVRQGKSRAAPGESGDGPDIGRCRVIRTGSILPVHAQDQVGHGLVEFGGI
jgi:hypothetical protein